MNPPTHPTIVSQLVIDSWEGAIALDGNQLAACARVSIEGGPAHMAQVGCLCSSEHRRRPRVYGSSRWKKTAKMERDIAKYVGASHPIYVT